MINAIADISHFQSPVDFATMAAGGIAAVICKTTQGITFTDPNFAGYVAAARAVGLLVGAYHYYDTTVDPIAQADYFLSVATASDVSVLVVDFEPSSATTTEQDAAAVMVQSLVAKTGRYPLLYTGRWDIIPEALPKTRWIPYRHTPIGRISMAPTDAALLASTLWIAEWTTAAIPNLPPGFATWTFWQYESSLNAVPGVSGQCDRSYYNGSLAQLESWWTQMTPQPPPPPTETVLKVTSLHGEATDSQGNVVKFNLRGVLPSFLLVLALATASVVGCCIREQTRTQVAHNFDWSGTTFRFDGGAGRTLQVVPLQH